MVRSGHRRATVVYVLIVLVIAAAAGVAASVLYGYWQGQSAYDRVADTAFTDPVGQTLGDGADGGAGEGSKLTDVRVDWDALRAINPDIVGWVYVPDTAINYPVVRGRDNEEYLYVNFNGEYGNGLQPTYGTPFLLAQNAADFSDPVNIIQGHDMANGTMFADIPKLEDDEAFNAHRTVYLLTPQRNCRLESVAMVVCSPYDAIVQTTFASKDEFTAYAQGMLDRSVVNADPAAPAAKDMGTIVALSTCTADGGSARCLLMCTVVEYVDVGGDVGSSAGAGQGDADEDAAQAIGDAASQQ